MSYRWHVRDESVERIADGAVIPCDPGNRDWRAVDAWVAAGNSIAPATSIQARAAAVLRRVEHGRSKEKSK